MWHLLSWMLDQYKYFWGGICMFRRIWIETHGNEDWFVCFSLLAVVMHTFLVRWVHILVPHRTGWNNLCGSCLACC